MSWKFFRTMLLLVQSMLSVGPSIAQKWDGETDVTLENKNLLKEAVELAKLEATKINAVFSFKPKLDKEDLKSGILPVHEDGKYKCIYWRAEPVPIIYATVTMNESVDLSSVVIDTTIRQFNRFEADLYQLYLATFIDYAYRLEIRSPPPEKAYFSFVPIVGKFGRKVYVDFRSNQTDRFYFGNDIEYTFNDGYEIVSRLKMHNTKTEINLSNDSSGPYGGFFHEHQSEGISGLCVTDLATAFLYQAKYKFPNFVFKDKRYLYRFDFTTSRLSAAWHNENGRRESRRVLSNKNDLDFDISAVGLVAQSYEFALLEGVCTFGGSYLMCDSCSFFPIHEGNVYKLVSFNLGPLPTVRGTVTFDGKGSIFPIAIDSVRRNFTAAELQVYNLYEKVVGAAQMNRNSRIFEDAGLLAIPINTVYGQKFYMVWRSVNRQIFAEDYEFTFNAKDELVSKVKLHKQLKDLSLVVTEADRPPKGGLYHAHMEDPLPGALIADLGGLMFANRWLRCENFALADKRNVYMVECETNQVKQMTHSAFRKLKLKFTEF